MDGGNQGNSDASPPAYASPPPLAQPQPFTQQQLQQPFFPQPAIQQPTIQQQQQVFNQSQAPISPARTTPFQVDPILMMPAGPPSSTSPPPPPVFQVTSNMVNLARNALTDPATLAVLTARQTKLQKAVQSLHASKVNHGVGSMFGRAVLVFLIQSVVGPVLFNVIPGSYPIIVLNYWRLWLLGGIVSVSAFASFVWLVMTISVGRLAHVKMANELSGVLPGMQAEDADHVLSYDLQPPLRTGFNYVFAIVVRLRQPPQQPLPQQPYQQPPNQEQSQPQQMYQQPLNQPYQQQPYQQQPYQQQPYQQQPYQQQPYQQQPYQLTLNLQTEQQVTVSAGNGSTSQVQLLSRLS